MHEAAVREDRAQRSTSFSCRLLNWSAPAGSAPAAIRSSSHSHWKTAASKTLVGVSALYS